MRTGWQNCKYLITYTFLEEKAKLSLKNSLLAYYQYIKNIYSEYLFNPVDSIFIYQSHFYT